MKMYEFYDNEVRVVDNATYRMFLQNKEKKIDCSLRKDDGRILIEYFNGFGVFNNIPEDEIITLKDLEVAE